jgi:exoribonuclease R
MLYKITVADRNYSNFHVTNNDNGERIDLGLDPVSLKLFSNDTFEYELESLKVNIIHSLIRTLDNIPAVLILDGNKTYGRHPNNNKLMYKCVPDDVQLPPFLVAYEIKQMGFSKVFVNQYVTIKFASWDSKHPVGVLTNAIGPVDVPENFYEYQLYCKGLNISLTKFNKALNKSLSDLVVKKETFIQDLLTKSETVLEDRSDWQVFTIDPDGSLDFDDAFSIKNGDNGFTLVSIYIANVPLCLDRLNLWSYLTKRTSTAYLPDKKRPMLPVLLSDCLCSLQEGAQRFAFTLDLEINLEGEIVSKKFCNTIIKVFKNFAYEERALIRHPLYKSLFSVVLKMVDKHPYIKHIDDSHDVVCYLMILMNHLAAKDLLGFGQGIFRSTTTSSNDTLNNSNVLPSDVSLNKTLPTEVLQFINIYRSTSGSYTTATSATVTAHSILGLDAYIHITSPIRRLVDILNMIKFQEIIGFKLSDSALEFYDTWFKDIEHINTSMKLLRRVQNDCNLLHLCHSNPSVLDKVYSGYCFDEKQLENGLYKYNLYLPELKTTSFVICGKLALLVEHQFKLFVFNNEDKMKKKIRLHLV